MGLSGPNLASSGTDVTLTASGVIGNVGGYAIINGVEVPIRIIQVPHQTALIKFRIPDNAMYDVEVLISDDNGLRSHVILIA